MVVLFKRHELHFLHRNRNREDIHEYPLCILFCLHIHMPMFILYSGSEGNHHTKEIPQYQFIFIALDFKLY
jgi:hypothetical protein